MRTKCHNCSKPAMFLVGPEGARAPLCLDCYTKLAQVITAQNEMLQREIDSTEAEIYETFGLPIPQRLRRPTPQYFTGSINVSNIDVKDSSIGVLNTGTLNIVASAIGTLNNAGLHQIAAAISELTQATIQHNTLSPDQKNEIMELISALASEATLPPQNRRRGLLESLLLSLSNAIGATSGLITIWDKVKPILESLLH
jgi:hypothetical protein